MMSNFKILHKDGKARAGRLQTVHGVIETPNFIPVGTQGTVKALSPKDLKETGVQVVLANTYHLMLRPGEDLIKSLGGLHKFMGWDGPIMTDSGGFQVFSLGVAMEHGVGKLLREIDNGGVKPRMNKITEDGVIFQSHIDGSKHTLTAEKSLLIQLKLGADLIVAFDDLESPKYSYEETLSSLERTNRWEFRSLVEYKDGRVASLPHLPGEKRLSPLLYGVTHGGIFKDLRVRSARFVDKYFDGIALGGAHKDRKTLYKVVEWTVANVSNEKPRHLLGIGEVEDLFNGIERGVDLFDSAAPTRRARNGSLYVGPKSKIYADVGKLRLQNYTLNIRKSQFAKDPNPIDPTCNCYSCQNFTRAYLRHLFMANELLYYQLATYHNLYFISDLVRKMREAIRVGNFEKLRREWLFR